MERVVELLLAAAGAWVILRGARAWRGMPNVRESWLLLLVPVIFFGAGIAGGGSQADLDFTYHFAPYRTPGVPAPRARNPLQSDIALQILPFRHLVRRQFGEGYWPHWSHELGTGQPLAGNAQSAPMALAQLPTLLLAPERGQPIAAAWHQLIAALGAFLLARSLGIGRAGALVAAYAFSASLFQTVWASYPLAMTTAWLPLAVLGARAVVRSEAGGALASCIVLFCSATEGHPVEFAQVVIGATGAALLAVPRTGWLSAARAICRFAGCVAIAVLMALPALGPVLEAFGESERRVYVDSGQPAAVAPLDFAQLAFILDPFTDGSPRDANWKGPVNFSERATLFVGLLPLAAVLVGWSGSKGRSRRLAGIAAAMLALLLLLPVWQFLMAGVRFLPHLVSPRMRFLWVLAAALLAGSLTSEIASVPLRRRLGAALVLLGIATAIQGVVQEAPLPQRAWRLGAGGGAVAAGVLAWTAGGLGGLALALPTLTLLDASLAGARYNAVDPEHRTLETPAVVRALQAAVAEEHEPVRSVAIGPVLPGYLPSIYGLLDPRGWDPMRPADALQLLRPRLDRPALRGAFQQRQELDLGLHRFLGIRYVLAREERSPGPPWVRGLTVGEVTLWRNPQAWPLVFVPRAVAYRTRDRIRAQLSAGEWPETVLVEDPAEADREQDGRVLAYTLGPDGFRGEVDLARAGLVGTSFTWMPGWSVEADQSEVSTHRIDGGFLGFDLPAGSHHFEARYRPRGWPAFLGLSGAGWLVFAGIVVSRVRRRSLPPAY